MIRTIEFTSNRFKNENGHNLFSPISNNTIILCIDYKIMDSLTKEILNTVNGNVVCNNYDCDDEDINNAKICLSYDLQRIIDINGQKITLSLEPAIIYKANDIKEIWLSEHTGTDEIKTLPPYREYIYPLCIFKGVNKLWEDDKDEIYRNICSRRYGAFDGNWIDLHGDGKNS